MKLSKDIAAVVTGGASGLGEGSARRLAAGGARVALFDLNEERGEARQQLEAVRGELQALRDAQEAQKEAAEAAAADRLDQDIKTEAPDIHSNDDAFRMLMHLLLSGADRQTAYRAVRAALDMKPEKKAVEPPPSVAAMAAGSLDGAPEQNGDVDSLFKRLYQNAESADGVSQI